MPNSALYLTNLYSYLPQGMKESSFSVATGSLKVIKYLIQRQSGIFQTHGKRKEK